ncbi:MAG: YdeI/OmpD-associated family protein [Firmicutes bacterium]|nr:YdeI/OmpD-associated family protein [Bacillota bacterium]
MSERDIPLELSMAIAGDLEAAKYFKSLTAAQKNLVINYVESKTPSGDADKAISDAVDSLRRCDNSLFAGK